MNRGVTRRIAGILCALLLLLTMSGCSRQVPKEKTVIKILYNEDFKKIEELVESTYDDIDIQTELSLYPSEQLRRLNRGVGPDPVSYTHLAWRLTGVWFLACLEPMARENPQQLNASWEQREPTQVLSVFWEQTLCKTEKNFLKK